MQRAKSSQSKVNVYHFRLCLFIKSLNHAHNTHAYIRGHLPMKRQKEMDINVCNPKIVSNWVFACISFAKSSIYERLYTYTYTESKTNFTQTHRTLQQPSITKSLVERRKLVMR